MNPALLPPEWQAKVADQIRANFEDAEDAPEGVELFHWQWAPLGAQEWLFPVPDDPWGAALPAPSFDPASYSPEPVCWVGQAYLFTSPDGTFRAGVGWCVEHRNAVVFFLNGGVLPERHTVDPMDTVLRRLAQDGLQIRVAEMLREITEKLEELDREPWEKGGDLPFLDDST